MHRFASNCTNRKMNGQINMESHQFAPGSIAGNLESSIQAANWLQTTDAATVAMARRLAIAVDVALDTGEIRDVTQLSGKLIGVLQQLHLTVETRTQGKQEVESDGSEHIGNYLRLLQTPDTKSKPKTANRRTGSQ
jgi:hypothetical protein